jgi:hypothetical protein
MSAINRNMRHSSRSQPSSVDLERSWKLVISIVTMYQDFWLLPTKFQLTTLTRLNRSPLSIPIVYVVSVRRLVPSAVNQSLGVALVLKHLDYGNAAQAGLPSYLHRRLLSTLVGRRPIHRSDLFTDTLATFHWLRSTERIQFKLAVIVYRSLHSTALGYQSSELAYIVWLTFHWTSTTSDNPPGEYRR